MIIGTFQSVDDNDILTNYNDETLRKQVDDSDQTSNINTVTEQQKKTLEELGIKLENDKLSSEQHDAFQTLIENNCDLFVTSLAELGITNPIQNQIGTDNLPPVRQRCYCNSSQITRKVNR